MINSAQIQTQQESQQKEAVSDASSVNSAPSPEPSASAASKPASPPPIIEKLKASDFEGSNAYKKFYKTKSMKIWGIEAYSDKNFKLVEDYDITI